MRTICISPPEEPERRKVAERHFNERGLGVSFFDGIHAQAQGLFTTHPYLQDNPVGGGVIIPQCKVGCYLSHYTAWLACSLLPDDKFLILENDAEFPADWKDRLAHAFADTPDDADMLFIGSCNTADKPKRQISGTVFAVEWPMASHAYIVWDKAIPVLLSTMRDVYGPVDLVLILSAFPKLHVYTVLPRIVDQRGMNLLP